MDKLKENAFGIAVVLVGVVLLALTFFLVVQPLQVLSTKRDAVAKQTDSLQRLLRNKKMEGKVPTAAARDFLEQRVAENKEALRNALKFYEDQGERFRQVFPDMGLPPEMSLFTAKYNDNIDAFVSEYQQKFGVAPSPDNPEEIVPKVSKMDPSDPDMLLLVQKEYWAIEAIFQACNALELGGLKEIDFPGRLASSSKDPRQYRKYYSVAVKIAMPFSKIEDLLTMLYENPTVPFVLEELTVSKTLESLGQHLSLEKVVDFKDEAESGRADYDALIPEPDCVVDLKLEAMEWQGIPKEMLNLEKEE